MSFKAYIENVEAKSGKTRDEIFQIAQQKASLQMAKLLLNTSSFLSGLKATLA